MLWSYIVISPDQLKELLSKDLERVSLLSFWAEWAAPCKGMNEKVKEHAGKYPDVLVLSVCGFSLSRCADTKGSVKQIDAEKQEEISESFEIESVPSLLFLRVCVKLPHSVTSLSSAVLSRATLC